VSLHSKRHAPTSSAPNLGIVNILTVSKAHPVTDAGARRPAPCRNTMTSSVPRRRHGPVPQHPVHSGSPLELEASSQLCYALGRRDRVSPHLRPRGLRRGEKGYEAVAEELDETQPGEVPAAVARRVAADPIDGLGQAGPAEGEGPREPAELREELVGVDDIVLPGRGHRPAEAEDLGRLAEGGGGALDAAELGEGVNAVRGQGVDECLDGDGTGVS
jgi:hypothetical protein